MTYTLCTCRHSQYSKDQVVCLAEDRAIWTRLDASHSPGLQVHQNWQEAQVFHSLLHPVHVRTLSLTWRVCSVETIFQNLAPIWFLSWPSWMWMISLISFCQKWEKSFNIQAGQLWSFIFLRYEKKMRGWRVFIVDDFYSQFQNWQNITSLSEW